MAVDGVSGIDALPSKILHSSVVLEAFGNAATSINDNSSRFGKFVRLLFDPQGRVYGARISTYVLEKSRLVLQVGSPRTYTAAFKPPPFRGDPGLPPPQIRTSP